MPGIPTGCFGAGQQNSLKPTQYHTILKVGKVPHISGKLNSKAFPQTITFSRYF